MIFNKVENTTEININDEIGFWGITHSDFTNQLKEIEGDLHLNIASYGGVVSDAFAIYNSIKSHNGRVTANIYGDSASSATLIAMAADEIRIADNVMFLIHNVWGGVVGEADELREAADNMDKVNANIIEVYKKKTGLNKNTIKSLMNKGDWLTAKEAKSHGLVDTIVSAEEVINRTEAVLMNCANDEMKAALLEKVNQLNNNKNQFVMTEENKSWLSEQFDAIKNSLKKEEAPVVEEPKEETISKEEVSEMLNSVKEEFQNTLNTANEASAAKDEEIAALKAELDKKNAKPTEVKAEVKSPEAVDKKEEVSNTPVAELFVNRLSKKFNLKFK